MLAFSRMLYGTEVLVAYNVSGRRRKDRVVVDANLQPAGRPLTYLYGRTGTVPVELSPSGAHFVELELAAHEFVILQVRRGQHGHIRALDLANNGEGYGMSDVWRVERRERRLGAGSMPARARGLDPHCAISGSWPAAGKRTFC